MREAVRATIIFLLAFGFLAGLGAAGIAIHYWRKPEWTPGPSIPIDPKYCLRYPVVDGGFDLICQDPRVLRFKMSDDIDTPAISLHGTKSNLNCTLTESADGLNRHLECK